MKLIGLYLLSQIYYWVESRLHARRHKRTIPSYASFDTVTDGNTQKHTVIELKPYTIYNIAMRAFNSGGEGPTSVVVLAQTDEAGKLTTLQLCETIWLQSSIFRYSSVKLY